GIPANALFNNPYMICLDKPGQLYIVDELNNRLRRMDVLVPTVGIHEIHAQHLLLNVYPNPSNGTMTLDLRDVKEERNTVEVYNTVGQLIYKTQLAGGTSHQLNLGDSHKGLLFVIVSNTSGVRQKQIVVE
ncbi:MAG: T9SS type A sorting domain-containing protein, partial [Bacteroidia bacterium]